jgi:hypothetical protein
MSPFQIMSKLRKEFQSKIEECVTIARTVTHEESESWDSYLKNLSVTPITKEDRQERYTLNTSIQTGALPVELRRALEQHTASIRETMNNLKSEFGHHDWWIDRVEKPFLKVIDDIPQQTLMEYIGAVRLDSTTILKNAADVSYGYFDTTVQTGSKSHLCPTCRAARPAETDLTTCSFCGSSLF